MVRLAFVTLALSACSFDASGVATSGGSDARAGAPDAMTGSGADGRVPDAAPPTSPCPTADVDLVACYPFESGDLSKEPLDLSMYRNSGTSTDVTFVPSLAGHGSALSFSPTATSHVADSPSLDVTAITVEMFVFARTLPPPAGRAGLLDNNNQYGLFLAPDGTVRCALGSSTDMGLAVTAGAWTHIACTYDGITIRLYQDGKAGATLADKQGIPTSSTDGLGLGQNVPSGDHLDGAEDEVRVWRVARSQADVCADAGALCK